jgi:hypothetical protein
MQQNESARQNKPRSGPRMLHVYDGQALLGEISITDDEFTAFDVEGKKLGTFADQMAAAFAIGAAMKAGHRG